MCIIRCHVYWYASELSSVWWRVKMRPFPPAMNEIESVLREIESEREKGSICVWEKQRKSLKDISILNKFITLNFASSSNIACLQKRRIFRYFSFCYQNLLSFNSLLFLLLLILHHHLFSSSSASFILVEAAWIQRLKERTIANCHTFRCWRVNSIGIFVESFSLHIFGNSETRN